MESNGVLGREFWKGVFGMGIFVMLIFVWGFLVFLIFVWFVMFLEFAIVGNVIRI